MTGLDVLECLNDIDDDLLEAAAKQPVKASTNWVRLIAIAASILLVSGFGLRTFGMFSKDKQFNNTIVGFSLNGNAYENILSQDDAEIARHLLEDVPNLTKDDLGEKMGSVKMDVDGEKVSLTVYHLKSYPKDDTVCVIVFPDGSFQLYTLKENEP